MKLSVASRSCLWLIAIAFLAVLLMTTLGAPRDGCPDVVQLELPESAEHFVEHVRECWTNVEVPGNLLPLRVQLAADSFLFVPAYVGLLLVLAGQLARRVLGYEDWRLQLFWIAPVFTGLADWLENGLIFRAAENVLSELASAEAIDDVRAASLLKWDALAVNCFVVLAIVLTPILGRRAGVRPELIAAGGLAAMAGIAFIVGARMQPAQVWPGMGLVVLMLSMLSVWLIRLDLGMGQSSPPPTAAVGPR